MRERLKERREISELERMSVRVNAWKEEKGEKRKEKGHVGSGPGPDPQCWGC